MSILPEDYPSGSPERYNLQRILSGDLPMGAVSEMVRAWQCFQRLDADGKAGPATLETVPFERVPDDGSELIRPRNRSEVYSMFGDPGKGEPDPRWEKANIVECHERGSRPRLPGVPAKWWVKVHHKVEPALREALRRANEYAPEYEIERLGGYVFRHQRHDPSRPLSYHSWGIAVDIDAAKNSAKTFDGGSAPEPWSEEWMRIWPDGLPEGFVRAFEEVGFVWGGRWKTYSDSQHLQWVD